MGTRTVIVGAASEITGTPDDSPLRVTYGVKLNFEGDPSGDFRAER
ncbi:MAG: hypothetical protein FWG25_05235 [Promicromonosporaceae bacterium]|nr:hypothetical protein [Promicromonosporaceae bacterium]